MKTQRTNSGLVGSFLVHIIPIVLMQSVDALLVVVDEGDNGLMLEIINL